MIREDTTMNWHMTLSEEVNYVSIVHSSVGMHPKDEATLNNEEIKLVAGGIS